MALWTPSQLATTLWLDASDITTITESSGLVSQWDDKSGNNNHAVQTLGSLQPLNAVNTMNSLNLLTFSADSMNTTSAVNIRACIVLLNSIDNANLVIPIHADNAGTDYTFILGNANDYDISIDGSGSTTGNASVNGGSLVSGTNIELGLTQAQKQGSNIWYSDYDTSVVVEGIFRQASNRLSGKVAEFIALPAVPSETDRQKIEGYLAHKWGLTGSLPADHPYKLSAPTTDTSLSLDLTTLNVNRSVQNLDANLSIELNLEVLNIAKSILNTDLVLQDALINLNLSVINIDKALLAPLLSITNQQLSLNLLTINIDRNLLIMETSIRDIKGVIFTFLSRNKSIFAFTKHIGGLIMNIFKKQPSEIIPISVDFSKLVDTNETILTVSVTAYDNANQDVTTHIIDAYEIETSLIKIVVKNGMNAKKYKITVLVTTSEGNKYEEDVFMYVDDI